MFCKSIGWFICLSVALVIATNYSEPGFFTDFTTEPIHVVEETTAKDLGDLLDAGDAAIVTLVAGDTQLMAHRAVLSARSPVFAAMLGDGRLGASSGELAVPDLEGPVLRHLLAYMYTQQAPQLPSMAPQLLAAADRYGLSALRETCEQQMAAQLSVENAAATAVFAIKNSYTSLRDAAIAFIKAQIFNVLATQGWANLAHNQPREIVEVSHLLSERRPEKSTPATADSAATPATQQYGDHSGRSQAPVSTSSPPTAASTTPQPDDADFSASTTPPTDDADFSTSNTQPPDDAAFSANTTPQPDDNAFSYLRNLSAEEKGNRLIEAARKGAVKELEALLAAGADVEARDYDRWTALHRAAWGGWSGAARCLLAAGAEADARDRWRLTPLHRAAYNGHVHVVRLLLEEASADPNATGEDGSTPLHFAAERGNAEVATALLLAGADRTIKDNWGRTPLDLANHYRRSEKLIDILSSS